MIHPFSLAAVCCIPIHNPKQRQKELKILAQPALKQLRESWESMFPADLHEVVPESGKGVTGTIRAFTNGGSIPQVASRGRRGT